MNMKISYPQNPSSTTRRIATSALSRRPAGRAQAQNPSSTTRRIATKSQSPRPCPLPPSEPIVHYKKDCDSHVQRCDSGEVPIRASLLSCSNRWIALCPDSKTNTASKPPVCPDGITHPQGGISLPFAPVIANRSSAISPTASCTSRPSGKLHPVFGKKFHNIPPHTCPSTPSW